MPKYVRYACQWELFQNIYDVVAPFKLAISRKLHALLQDANNMKIYNFWRVWIQIICKLKHFWSILRANGRVINSFHIMNYKSDSNFGLTPAICYINLLEVMKVLIKYYVTESN
jgi:hypothetical protein